MLYTAHSHFSSDVPTWPFQTTPKLYSLPYTGIVKNPNVEKTVMFLILMMYSTSSFIYRAVRLTPNSQYSSIFLILKTVRSIYL